VSEIKNVPSDAYDKVRLLAHAWEVSEGQVVARLVERFAQTAKPDSAGASRRAGGVPVYAVYEATRIDAVFDPATRAVTIVSGTLQGKTYSTPSGAAVAVVTANNPGINPNRNGWSFWLLAENGRLLQTIRER
jgi:hypothetical protein